MHLSFYFMRKAVLKNKITSRTITVGIGVENESVHDMIGLLIYIR